MHGHFNYRASLVEAPEVMAEMPVERDANEYNMNHEHRGKAIIFNHKVKPSLC